MRLFIIGLLTLAPATVFGGDGGLDPIPNGENIVLCLSTEPCKFLSRTPCQNFIIPGALSTYLPRDAKPGDPGVFEGSSRCGWSYFFGQPFDCANAPSSYTCP